MSDTNHTAAEQNNEHHPSAEAMRRRAHELLDRLPDDEMRAAIIALEELEVSVQVRSKGMERERGADSEG